MALVDVSHQYAGQHAEQRKRQDHQRMQMQIQQSAQADQADGYFQQLNRSPTPNVGGHESWALASPLEQLTRKLSVTRNESRQPFPRRSSSRGATATSRDGHKAEKDTDGRVNTRTEAAKGFQFPEQAAEQHLTNSQSRNAPHRPPPLITASNSHGSFLHLAADDYDNASPVSNSSNVVVRDEPEIRPVQFSPRERHRNDSSTSRSTLEHGDNSDAHSQLINAFRNSYSDNLTSAGNRESSYSWMTSNPDADPETPGITLDFAEAARNAADGAYTANNYATTSYAHANNRLSPNESGHAGEASEWNGRISEEELSDRAKARISSWDSTAAQAMNLRRVPSKTRGAVMGRGSHAETERTSAFSSLDPFAYAVSHSIHK